jgi:hypothetical protein
MKLVFVASALLMASSSFAAAQEFFCNQERSQDEVRRLTDKHVIVSVDVFIPNVTVVVDERAWQRLELTEKKAMAQNVDCATGGSNNHMVHYIYFRGNRNNGALADFSGNELTVRAAESR